MAVCLFFSFVLCNAQHTGAQSDQWAATDALGRTVGRYDGVKTDKQVFMFYWTWHERYDAPGTDAEGYGELLLGRTPFGLLSHHGHMGAEKACRNAG